jgi:hypothetical protein
MPVKDCRVPLCHGWSSQHLPHLRSDGGVYVGLVWVHVIGMWYGLCETGVESLPCLAEGLTLQGLQTA